MNRRKAIKQFTLAAAAFPVIGLAADVGSYNNPTNSRRMNLGILLFEKVEELDFVGPLEVFNVANDAVGSTVFNVFTVSVGNKQVKAVNNLQVNSDYTLNDCPDLDILLIPGGNGRKLIMKDPVILEWVKAKYKKVKLMLSVCTGAFVLGHAGLLTNKNATTNMQCYDEFKVAFPHTRLKENVKYVKDGNIVTSGGISAGINMSLFVVGDLLGKEIANKVAALMEYDYTEG
jgi:transcriptional regulator GlxA family with amidase domain